MELKESVMMDITETFRGGEDITKTDFFDFVVTPDSQDTHSIQQFSKQMRTVNAFLGNPSPEDDGSSSIKETNNNMLTIEMNHHQIPTTTSSENFDANFWNDKEAVKIETAILEDLNKYCWSTEDGGIVTAGGAKANTDGQIYTLTVLNGLDQSATWYRPPITVKEEEGSMSSPNSMEHLQNGLDIDSILSIIPGQMNGFNNNYNESTMSPNTDGLIKSETYTYEDSGFADNKDELANSLIIDTPLLEAHDSFNNNNNDWKLSNNNDTSSSNNGGGASSPDSLLRSALQGKAFVRYNGANVKTNSKLENNTELRRVLSTPPGKSEPTTIYIKQEEPDMIPTIVAGIDANGKVVFEESIPQRTSSDQENTTNSLNHQHNHHQQQQHHHHQQQQQQQHSVDDLLLSQLDQSFPEDFEKLKRIANEVAESVSQYCHIDQSSTENTSTTSTTAVYSISPDQIGILSSIGSPIQITTTAPTVSTTTTPGSGGASKSTKKYKRSNSNSTKSQQQANNNNNNNSQVQNATSSSPGSSSNTNGVRKERSLHYCSICSKGFKDKYSVNVHIRTHTGEKPFACSLCGKSFRQKAHLAKHYQTHIAQKNAAAAGGGGGNVTTAKTKSR